MEGNFLSLIRTIYKTPTVNVFSGERQRFPPWDQEQDMDVYTHYFSIVLEVLAIRQEKERKSI